MAKASIKDSIINQIEKLSPELQRRVLDYAKSLAPHGVAGKSLLRFEGVFPADDLQVMSKAIEEGCERVDIGEW